MCICRIMFLTGASNNYNDSFPVFLSFFSFFAPHRFRRAPGGGGGFREGVLGGGGGGGGFGRFGGGGGGGDRLPLPPLALPLTIPSP